MATESSARSIPGHRLTIVNLVFGLACLAFVIFFVQAINYNSIFAGLAEWQFAHLGRYFPTLTMVVLIGLVGLAAFLASIVVRRVMQGPRTEAEIVQSRSRWAREQIFLRLAHLFLAASLLAALVALGNLIHILQMPQDKGDRQILSLSDVRGHSVAQGPVLVKNMRVMGPIGHYADDLIFYRRTTFLAPVAVSLEANSEKRLTAFVEISAEEANKGRFLASREGVLRRGGLAPEVAAMYRNAGFAVAANAPVVFQSAASMRRSAAVLLVEFLALSFLTLLFSLYSRLQHRRLEKERLGLSKP